MLTLLGAGPGQSDDNASFEFLVDTRIAGDLPDNQFQLRTHGQDVYQGNDFTLKTSDGQQFDNVTAATLTITFPSPGIYELKVSGKFCGLKTASNAEANKIIDVLNWGDWEELQWVRAGQSFRDCVNLTTFSATDAPYLGGLDSQGISTMFYNCTNLNADFSKWDVSPVSNFGNLFGRCSNFNNDSICNWDMSNATSLYGMFQYASIFNQDLSAWNTSNVSDMSVMFFFASQFNGNISNWNTSSLSGNLFRTFSRSAFNGDLSGWNISNVNNLNNTFAYSSFSNNSVVNWDTSNVANFTATFANTPFNHDLNNWDVSSATLMGSMFSSSAFDNGGVALNWDVSNVTNMSFMFYNCIFNQDVSSWDVSNVTTMQGMFQDRGNKTNSNMNISGWTTTSLQSTFQMFRGHGTNVQDLSAWDMSNNVNLQEMFQFGRCDFNPSAWNIQGAVKLRGVFNNATTSTGITDSWNFKDWDISQCTDLTNFIFPKTLKTYNYDDTLISWSEQAPANALSVHFGNSKYTENSVAAEARDTLINTYGWTIVDGGAEASAFVMTVDTTLGSGTNDFLIPTNGSGYNYTVETSDGQTLTGLTGNTTVTFAEPGVYDVEITGDFPQVYFNGANDYQKLTKVKSWGSIKWTYFQFKRCWNMNVTCLNAPDLRRVTSLGSTFMRCTSFNGDISRWDVSRITDLGNFLYGEYQMMNFAGDVSNWDVSSVKSWYQAFRDNIYFNSDISGWNMSNARNLTSAFYNNQSLSADLSGWDIQRCSYLTNAFRFCNNLSFDPSGWDFSGIRSANNAFEGCSLMPDFNVSALDIRRISNGTSFTTNNIFSTASIDAAFTTWSTQNVTKDATFRLNGNCSLNGIAGRNKLVNDYKWTITSGAIDTNAFIITVDTANAGGSASNQFTIPTFTGETYNYDIVTSDDQSITGVTGDHTITFASPGVYTIAITGTFPRIHFGTLAITADKQKLLSVERWGPQAWTSFNEAFIGCTNLQVNATDAPVLTACTDMSDMFNGCTSVNRSFASWNVSTITTLDDMFNGATAYDSSLGAWNVSAVTSAANMFLGAGMSRLQYEDTLTGWGALPSLQNSVSINFGSATYAAGFDAETAKTSIISTYSWIITDGGSVAYSPYTITIDTTLGSGTNDFLLPLTGSNIKIETSDGQVLTGISGNTLISFAAPGVYDIEVSGGVTSSRINNGTDKLKLTDVKQWGDPVWTNASYMFRGAQNMVMTAIDAPNLTKANSLAYMFYDADSFNSSIDHWDVSNIKDLTRTFALMNNGYSQSLNSWDVSNVTSMYGTFQDGNVVPLVSNWNTHKLQILYAAFRGNNSFDQDLTGWDVSGVIDTGYGVFRGSPISGSNISNWDVRRFSTFSRMFEYSSGNPDITAWNMYGHNIGAMFAQSNFNQDISGWDISKTTSLNQCFTNNEQFNQPIGSWDTSRVTDIGRMFNNNVGQYFAFDQDLSGWNVESIRSAADFGDPVYFQLSTANYDALLISWAAQNVQNNVVIGFGTSRYNEGGAAEAARNTLINTYNWTITDGGGIAPPPPPPTTYMDQLVASYNFDADFSDLTGNHNATSFGGGTAGIVSGKVGNAYNTPDNAYLSVSDSTDFSFTDGVNDLPFSISTWVNFITIKAGSDGQWFVCKRDGNGNEWQFYYLQGKLTLAVFSQGATSAFLRVEANTGFSTGTWYHLAATYDGSGSASGINIYLDGVLLTLTDSSSGTYLGMSDTNAAVYVGTGGWNPTYHEFVGYMDETHIWKNRELTSAKVLDIYNTENAGSSIFTDFTTNLVASYNFDVDFTDYTGVNNGTAAGTPLAAQSGGVVSNCLLNNASSYVDMGNDASLQATQYSVSAWLKCGAPGGSYRGIVVKQNTFGIFLQNNELGVYGWLGTGWVGTGQFLNDNNWHHVVFTFDDGVSNGAQLYLDGSPLGSPFTFVINNQSVPLVVGAGAATTTQSFNGNIDEVHVWTNRLLTSAEVLDIYNTENAGNSIL